MTNLKKIEVTLAYLDSDATELVDAEVMTVVDGALLISAGDEPIYIVAPGQWRKAKEKQW